ncbi:MAG TPA: hypothetical protein PLZ16_02245 [Gammaproteobacteria bacterium]|nr:hypothetical protein [Gammaproteobacteria bacterium]
MAVKANSLRNPCPLALVKFSQHKCHPGQISQNPLKLKPEARLL